MAETVNLEIVQDGDTVNLTIAQVGIQGEPGASVTLLDEDDFASDSNTQGATQQSIKAYVDASSASINEGNVWRPAILEANTAQQNADLINADIVSATSVFGSVILPAGSYNCRTINYNPAVKLYGQSRVGTELVSTNAEPLISYTSTTFVGGAQVSNLKLNGDEIGTIGLQVYSTAGFDFNNLVFRDFTVRHVDLQAALIGTFYRCNMRGAPEGIKNLAASTNIGTLNANLVTFRDCVWHTIDDWAINWNEGASIQFLGGCNFEYCGTSGDSATGVIKATNMCNAGVESEGIGILLDGAWGEYNNGTMFQISGSTTSNTGRHAIRNSMFQYGSPVPATMNFNGGELLIDNSNLNSGGVTIVNGSLETRNSRIGAVTLQNSSTWKKDNSENLTGTALNLGNPNGDSYNFSSASSATTYTTINLVEGAFVSCLVNAASKPAVTGGTEITGATFASSTDMEMIVEVKNGAVRYYFLEI